MQNNANYEFALSEYLSCIEQIVGFCQRLIDRGNPAINELGVFLDPDFVPGSDTQYFGANFYNKLKPVFGDIYEEYQGKQPQVDLYRNFSHSLWDLFYDRCRCLYRLFEAEMQNGNPDPGYLKTALEDIKTGWVLAARNQMAHHNKSYKPTKLLCHMSDLFVVGIKGLEMICRDLDNRSLKPEYADTVLYLRIVSSDFAELKRNASFSRHTLSFIDASFEDASRNGRVIEASPDFQRRVSSCLYRNALWSVSHEGGWDLIDTCDCYGSIYLLEYENPFEYFEHIDTVNCISVR